MLALSITLGQLSADAPALFERGRQAFERGDFSQAIRHWQQALADSPGQQPTAAEFQASIALAGAYQAIGQQSKAARFLEEALASAEPPGDREWQTRLQIRLGGALVMILELDRAASLLV